MNKAMGEKGREDDLKSLSEDTLFFAMDSEPSSLSPTRTYPYLHSNLLTS
jgi:hypothetical protein